MSEKVKKHELIELEACSLFNSSHAYADGFSIAICSCRWKSASLKNEKALVALFEVHLKQKGVIK